MDQRIFDDDWTLGFFRFLQNKDLSIEYFRKKRKIIFYSNGHRKLLSIRISTTLMFFEQKLDLHAQDFINYVLILIKSGMASVAFFENGNMADHKVFRAYMVRKKQGKSQLKYLKTKGKSRAGSRVRLAESEVFFSSINERVNTYFENYRVDLIGLSCSETLLPYFYNNTIPGSFERKDSRLFKIPKHIASPKLENLIELDKYLKKNVIEMEAEGNYLFEEFKDSSINRKIEGQEDDNW
ncbi:hypothetical protein EF405_04695 [Cyclobacteriaceae bacterium YHN15]|jgi:hypothetical protein|nr:hypothetical protein EF405_04695 [Cyclobacteriaceae bacterium YHN15]